jgi:hypothetical protein
MQPGNNITLDNLPTNDKIGIVITLSAMPTSLHSYTCSNPIASEAC